MEDKRALENYGLIKVVGRGAFAKVFKARHVKTKKAYALKVFAGDQRSIELDSFIAESLITQKINHPWVRKSFGHLNQWNEDFTKNTYFGIYEYVSGGSLADFLDRCDKPAPYRTTASICTKIASALYATHQAGVLHRDVKPENILLDKNGTPKLADFGSAVLLDRDPQDLELRTMTGEIRGTMAYMSPEQIQNRAGITSDIFSLGVILYEMLTGCLPWEGDSSQIASKILAETPIISPVERIPSIPQMLNIICKKCLRYDSSRRFLDAIALEGALIDFLASY